MWEECITGGNIKLNYWKQYIAISLGKEKMAKMTRLLELFQFGLACLEGVVFFLFQSIIIINLTLFSLLHRIRKVTRISSWRILVLPKRYCRTMDVVLYVELQVRLLYQSIQISLHFESNISYSTVPYRIHGTGNSRTVSSLRHKV